MPKKELKLTQFHGGLSNDSNIRDIIENEFPVIKGANIDHIGKVTVMGDKKTVSFSITGIVNLTPGYGILVFGADHSLPGSSGDKKFIAIAGVQTTTGDYICKIYENDATAYGTTLTLNDVSVTKDTGIFQPVFYVVDGILRIIDSNFDNDGSNATGDDIGSVGVWFGYIKKTHFPGANVNEYDGWYSGNTDVLTPSRGLVGEGLEGMGHSTGCTATNLRIASADFIAEWEDDLNTETYTAVAWQIQKAVMVKEWVDTTNLRTGDLLGSDNWGSKPYQIHPPPGTGFNLAVAESSVSESTSWVAGDYIFAITFIYDDGQESTLFPLIGDSLSVSGSWAITGEIFLTLPYNPRLSGGRIYWRNETVESRWTLFMDIDFKKGYRFSLENDYVLLSHHSPVVGQSGALSNCYVDGSGKSYKPNADTYESLTGHTIDDEIISNIKYKTVTIANRVAYIGNVLVDGKSYEDSVFKSFVNNFDKFNTKRRLDIAIGDGEQVIKLENFADRLLLFKENTLYIVNISQEIEFLEAVQQFKGVTKPYHVCKTEFGIAWINKSGCYVYDGQQIVELFKRQGVRKISTTWWSSFFNDNSTIGYSPIRKKLIVVQKNNNNISEVLFYSFDTMAWTYEDHFNTEADMSNMDVDWNGKAIWARDGSGTTCTISDWDEEQYLANTKNFTIRTKDIDFDSPTIKKNIYKIVITYTGGGAGANLTVSRSPNGTNTWTNFSTKLDSTTTTQTKVEIKPSNTIRNINSLQLSISGTAHKNFELNDITIIYRELGVR